MAIERMYQLFDKLNRLIERLSKTPADKQLMEKSCFHMFTIIDGLEDFDDGPGLSLVDKEALPDGAEEINDDFLHDAWADYLRSRRNDVGGTGS